MRHAAALLMLLGTALGGPRTLIALPDAESAVKMARTRGKMIFLTVLVDGDAENRMVVDDLFRDAAFLRIAEEFVILYANLHDQHGKVMVRGKDGKKEPRCADCPSIRCEDHILLAQNYARGFYPTSTCRTPVHFVLDAQEKVVDILYNGDLETALNPVPAREVVARLTKLLEERGRGLTEKEYARLVEDLTDARAARAHGNTVLELSKLVDAISLGRDVEGVREAKARLAEIDAVAAREVEKADALAEARSFEEALDAYQAVLDGFPGTPTAERCDARRKEILDIPEVKDLLKAKDLYERGLKYKERRKLDLARKKFEDCVRRYPDTRYAGLARQELEHLGAG